MCTGPWLIACGIWDIACDWSYCRADGCELVTASGCVFCIDCIGVYDIADGYVCCIDS